MDGYVHDAQCLVYKGPHTKYLVSNWSNSKSGMTAGILTTVK